MNQEKQKIFKEFALAFEEMRYRILEEFIFDSSFDEEYSLSLAQFLDFKKQKDLLNAAYDHCKWLGMEIRNNFDVNWSVEEITDLLSYSGIPCVSGTWQRYGKRESVLITKRCIYNPELLKCHFWLKTLSGFTNGLNNKIFFDRYESIRKGTLQCTNIIYDSNYVNLPWKIIPEEINEKITPLKNRLSNLGVKLILDGYSKGSLFYHLEENKMSQLETLKNKIITNAALKISKLWMPEINFIERENKGFFL